MKYVEIPLNIAQRAARAYRPMLPYVRKFIAEQRQNKVDVVEVVELPTIDVASEYQKVRNEYESKTMSELLEIAKENGIKRVDKLPKEKLINKLLGQE